MNFQLNLYYSLLLSCPILYYCNLWPEKRDSSGRASYTCFGVVSICQNEILPCSTSAFLNNIIVVIVEIKAFHLVFLIKLFFSSTYLTLTILYIAAKNKKHIVTFVLLNDLCVAVVCVLSTFLVFWPHFIAVVQNLNITNSHHTNTCYWPRLKLYS